MDASDNRPADRDVIAWATVVALAMKERGFTQAQLAEELGISERTVRAMLSGRIGVTPERLMSISTLLQLDSVELFRLHNWVGAERAAAIDTSSAARDAVELLNDSAAAPRSGAALLVERALELGGYRMFVHSTVTADPADGHSIDRDYVGVERTGWGSDREAGRRSECLERELRDRFSVALRLAPALLEDSEERLAQLDEVWPNAQAWFWVPRLMATRPARRPAPLRGGVETVVVVGEHGAGASHIGAYLADKAGWGYVGTSFEAQRAFGRQPENQAAHAQHCLDIADAYLRSDHGRFRVIGHGNPATADEVVLRAAKSDSGADGRAPRRVAVVYARANDALIEYGIRVWNTRMDAVVPGVSADYRERNDAIAESANRARPGLVHTVPIDLPAEVLTRGGRQNEVHLEFLHRPAAEKVWLDVLHREPGER